MKIFIATAKNMAPELIDAFKAEIERYVREKAIVAEVTTARDEFNASARSFGTLDAWVKSISARFQLIVVPDAQIGRATADIVTHALRLNVPVAYWNGAPVRVRDVEHSVPGDWKRGWSLIF